MIILFILILVFIMINFFSQAIKEDVNKFKEITTKGKQPCPPEKGGIHSWSYNKDGKLECIKCNFIAGTYTTNNGDYGH